MESFFVQALDLGQPGLFVGGFLVLFRFLLTRHDKMAEANLAELRLQMRELRRRALRAELIVRAFNRAGLSMPEEQIAVELRLAEELYGLFPEYDRRDSDDEHPEGGRRSS